jgi:hypothetical protein
MKPNATLVKTSLKWLSYGIFGLLFAACGTQQQATYRDYDGIYGDEPTPKRPSYTVREAKQSNETALNYQYKSYFSALHQESEKGQIFTDVNSYGTNTTNNGQSPVANTAPNGNNSGYTNDQYNNNQNYNQNNNQGYNNGYSGLGNNGSGSNINVTVLGGNYWGGNANWYYPYYGWGSSWYYPYYGYSMIWNPWMGYTSPYYSYGWGYANPYWGYGYSPYPYYSNWGWFNNHHGNYAFANGYRGGNGYRYGNQMYNTGGVRGYDNYGGGRGYNTGGY